MMDFAWKPSIETVLQCISTFSGISRIIYLLTSLVQTTCTWVLPQTEEGHARRCSWLKGSPKQCRSHNWLQSLSLSQHKQVPSTAVPIIGQDDFTFLNTKKLQTIEVPWLVMTTFPFSAQTSPKQCRSLNWLRSLSLSQCKQVPSNAGPIIG